MTTDTVNNDELAQELQDHLYIIQELVVRLDREGNVVSINPNGCKILGRSRNELIGQNWFDTVISEADRPRLKQVFVDVLGGHYDKISQWENDIVTANGELRRSTSITLSFETAMGI